METVDNDTMVDTAVDTSVQQMDMFAMSNELGMSNKEGDQDDSEGSTNDTATPWIIIRHIQTRRKSIPESMPATKQEGLFPQSRLQMF
jgi:hypothetical protein